MGGGGAMRTAAKISGISVGRTGFRGAPAVHPAEQSVRNVSRSASTSVSSQGPKPTEVEQLHAASPWELDNWEFMDGGDLVMAAGEPMPRAVFGGVPTFEEAKEATSELKHAIEKIYLSSDSSSQCEGPSPGSQVSVLSCTNVELDTKCVTEAISNPSVPKHAIQAFQMLSTSPAVQTVVASIACDQNVWNAVMKNPAVNDFFQSHQKVAGFGEQDTPEKVEEFANSEAKEAPEEAKTHPENGSYDFIGILENLKLTVTEMVSRVSNYLQNIFPTAEKEKSFADADGDSNPNFMGRYMGGTLMGLAALVIMVVMVKRS